MKETSCAGRRDSGRRHFLTACVRVMAGSSLAALGLGRSPDFSGAVGERDSVGLAALPHAPAGGGQISSPHLLGLMADAARVPENISYYRRLIDFCREWKLNALLISITDDQGSALRFKSHPELITHRNALTSEEARSLGEYAQHRGVELIPIIESFGHTRYITGTPQYAGLADQPPGGRGHFDAVIPVAPETRRLMTDLYREAADIFPSRYFHGGCDEVNWGGSDLSRKALESRSGAEIWADYLNFLDQVARGLGKEFIVWGDYVLHKEPDILPRLHKDIIVMDWQYGQVDPRPLEEAARKVIATGLRAIGAPAVISCRWGPRPGLSALQNIEAYATAYRRISDPRAIGVIVTNWIPCRYLQDSIWDAFAYAAVALTEGGEQARVSALRSFVESHYGAEWNDDWADIFMTIYDIAPAKPPCAPPWAQPLLPVPWRSDEELKSAAQEGLNEAPPFARVVGQIITAEESVRRNFNDFSSFRLSVEYLEYLFWRNRIVAEEAKRPPRRHAAARLVRVIAERDQRMLARLSAEWDKGRPRDAASKLGPVFDFSPGDQLLFTFSRAAAYSAQLAQQPEHFARALRQGSNSACGRKPLHLPGGPVLSSKA